MQYIHIHVNAFSTTRILLVFYAFNTYSTQGKGAAARGATANEQHSDVMLGIASVRLPADAIEQRDNVIFFNVDVNPEEGIPWRVLRRYSNFYELQARLGLEARAFPGAPFPNKHYFGCSGPKLESRRQGLELWLMRALESPSSGGLWLQPLREFLCSGRQFIVDVPPASAPVLPEAPASLPAESMPTPSAPPKEALYRDDLTYSVHICIYEYLSKLLNSGLIFNYSGRWAVATLFPLEDPRLGNWSNEEANVALSERDLCLSGGSAGLTVSLAPPPWIWSQRHSIIKCRIVGHQRVN